MWEKKTRWDVFEMLARSRLQGWKIVLVKCEHKFDELEIPDGCQFELEIPDGSNNNSTTNSDFLSNYSLQIGQMRYESQVFFKFFFRFGLEGFWLAHLLPGDWFWLPPSFKIISLFKETGFQGRVILIDLCSAPKNYHLFAQWYHEMNNGSMRLLRTGATQGNPYSYSVRVGDFEIWLKAWTC